MKPASELAIELLDGPLAYFDYQGAVEALTEAIKKDRAEVIAEKSLKCPQCGFIIQMENI